MVIEHTLESLLTELGGKRGVLNGCRYLYVIGKFVSLSFDFEIYYLIQMLKLCDSF